MTIRRASRSKAQLYPFNIPCQFTVILKMKNFKPKNISDLTVYFIYTTSIVFSVILICKD